MSIKIYYMCDNHTFIGLPSNVDEAIKVLKVHFIERRETYGSLCTKDGPMARVMEHAYADWNEFAPRAQRWLEAALVPPVVVV